MGCQVDSKAAPERARLVDIDFRTSKLEEANLYPSFPGAFEFCRSQPDGLHICLPDEEIKHKETGVVVPFPLQGDFEVSVGYEVIAVGPGWGASVEIYLATNAPTKEGLGFNRVIVQDEPGDYFVTRLTTSAEGKRVDLPGDFARTTPVKPSGSSGQLRLARVGATAVLSARDTGSEFRELFRVPLGIEDVTKLRVGVNPRRVKPVEVRLLDLHVVGSSLIPNEAVAPRRVWWWFGAGLFAVAAVSGGLWHRWVRQRGTVPLPQADSSAPGPAAGPTPP